MNHKLNEWMNRGANEWLSKWMTEQTNESINDYKWVKIKYLGQVLGDFPNVLSFASNDESMQPSWSFNLSKDNTVGFLINLS